MVRPQAIPEHVRPEIERRIMVEKQSQQDILYWLADQGYTYKASTLKRRCKQWGISRRGLSTDPAVLDYINSQFHTTLDDDATIARGLNERGFPVTASTVKDMRLANGWRYNQVTTEQQVQ